MQYNGLRVFEALSASGLRAIRYFKEIPGLQTIHANDLDPAAVASIMRNGSFNGLDPTRFIASQVRRETRDIYPNFFAL